MSKNHSALAVLYASHVIQGKRTIEQVPNSLLEEVLVIMKENKT